MTGEGGEFELECIEERAMPPELDASIRGLLCECFPPDVEAFSRSRHWHDCAPAWTLIFRESGRVLGHVGVVVRTISWGRQQVQVAGIQSLAVCPHLRGSGLAQALMRRAAAEAGWRGVRFGFLFCGPGLERFYSRLGWRRTDAAVTMADENGRTVPMPAKNVAMALALADEPLPQGDIDLNGRDW